MNSKYLNQRYFSNTKMVKKHEPMERVTIDVSEEFIGSVIEKLGRRKGGELISMTEANGGYSRLEFSIPARGLIGYRGGIYDRYQG